MDHREKNWSHIRRDGNNTELLTPQDEDLFRTIKFKQKEFEQRKVSDTNTMRVSLEPINPAKKAAENIIAIKKSKKGGKT